MKAIQQALFNIVKVLNRCNSVEIEVRANGEGKEIYFPVLIILKLDILDQGDMLCKEVGRKDL